MSKWRKNCPNLLKRLRMYSIFSYGSSQNIFKISYSSVDLKSSFNIAHITLDCINYLHTFPFFVMPVVLFFSCHLKYICDNFVSIPI